MMNEKFEGSLVLEKLSLVGLVEEFYEAVDADDSVRIVKLLREADDS